MTDISSFPSAAAGKRISVLSVKKDSISDMDGIGEAHMHERADVPVTSLGSSEDSRGFTTPECDSIEVKAATASRWSSVQEALEACMDPFFLAGQSSVKDDSIVEELTRLMDVALTAHVPAVASLSFLQPLFTGRTRSERLDSVLSAARASNKLVLRDDLPVPLSSGFMLSVDEAEAAALRVGPRSHAEGVNRSVVSLERKHASMDCEAALRSLTLNQLQSTVPQHRIVKVERSEAPCVVRAVFVSPMAADRAYAVWRARAPHAEVRVARAAGNGSSSSNNNSSSAHPSKAMPCPPRPAAEPVPSVPAIPAPRTALKCPRVVGETLPRPGSIENVSGLQGSGKPAAVRATVPVPRPPPAIDAVLPGAAAKAAAAPSNTSGPSTTSTTPSPDGSSTTAPKSKFNMNATPFLPKSVLNAQLAAAAAAVAGGVGAPTSSTWWNGGARRSPTGSEEAVTPSPAMMDTSEALANQMLMDSNTGWMYAALDPYNAPAWTTKFTVVDNNNGNWESNNSNAALMNSDMAAASSSSSTPCLRKTSSVMVPERPKALGADMPTAPCALGDSPGPKDLLKPAGFADRSRATGLQPPRPLTVSLPADRIACSSLDNVAGAMAAAHTSPMSRSLPANTLSASRRHRHDPYSPTGFVLCAESSCASSLSHQPASMPGVPNSGCSNTKLLFAGSLTSEKMASFCFEDPLIKASARRRERRRLMEEQGGSIAAHTLSGEEENLSSTTLSHSQSARAEESSSEDVAEQQCATPLSDESAGTTTTTISTAAVAAEEAEAEAASSSTASAGVTTAATTAATAAVEIAVPKSYAEALRLKAKAAAPPLVAAVKATEAKKDKAGATSNAGSSHRSSAGAGKKTGAASASSHKTAATTSGAKAAAPGKPKKMTAAA